MPRPLPVAKAKSCEKQLVLSHSAALVVLFPSSSSSHASSKQYNAFIYESACGGSFQYPPTPPSPPSPPRLQLSFLVLSPRRGRSGVALGGICRALDMGLFNFPIYFLPPPPSICPVVSSHATCQPPARPPNFAILFCI